MTFPNPAALARHQDLYDQIVASHPSLIRSKVWCSCGKSRTVDPARCLRDGWPKCCGGTMSIEPVARKPAGVAP
jgi:hypothetical protein